MFLADLKMKDEADEWVTNYEEQGIVDKPTR